MQSSSKRLFLGAFLPEETPSYCKEACFVTGVALHKVERKSSNPRGGGPFLQAGEKDAEDQNQKSPKKDLPVIQGEEQRKPRLSRGTFTTYGREERKNRGELLPVHLELGELRLEKICSSQEDLPQGY